MNGWAGKNHAFDAIAVFFAEYFIWVALAAVLAYFLFVRKNYKAVIAGSAAFVMGRLVLAENIQLLFYRPRPYVDHAVVQLVAKSAAASFPSGHTASVVAIGMGLYPFSKKISLTVMACGVVIGFFRIVAGIHYPLDIVGGAAVGIAGGLLSNKLIKSKFGSFFHTT